jgi:ABC-2 type transport system permease protein
MTAPAVVRVTALARRDFIMELSYHFQLFLKFFTIGMSVVLFFFLGRLVGEQEELEGFRGGYFAFALLGLLVVSLSQACVTSFGQSIQSAQRDGTLEILLSTATRLPTLLAGTLIVPVTFALVEAAAYLAIGQAVGALRLTFESAALAIVLLVLTLGTFAAVGVMSATVIVLTKRGDPFSSMVLQATNLLAGALFPIAVLPEWMQTVSRGVPAFYGLRGIREVLLSDAGLSDITTDLLALSAFNLVLLPAAMWSLSRALRIARVTGTLGNR